MSKGLGLVNRVLGLGLMSSGLGLVNRVLGLGLVRSGLGLVNIVLGLGLMSSGLGLVSSIRSWSSSWSCQLRFLVLPHEVSLTSLHYTSLHLY